jgi:hypothetical protein
MATEILAAVIGVIGVLIGVALGEGLQWHRRRQDTKAREAGFRGTLIGLYYEMKQNQGLTQDLSKLEIRTFGRDPNIVRTIMLTECRRSYYPDLAPALIDTIESAYADLQDLVHLINTGPNGEHKKWPTKGTEVSGITLAAMALLRTRIKELGADLSAESASRSLPNKPLSPTGAGAPAG